MILPSPSAWRYTHQDETMRIISYSYEDVEPKNCNHPNYVGMFTAGQLNEYGQDCFYEGVSSIHTLGTAHARDLAAYELTVEDLTASHAALTERVKALEADAERYRAASGGCAMSLPPLPKKLILHTQIPGHYWYGDVVGHTDAAMQAYGQACREAALEDAARLCNGEQWMMSGKKSIDYINAFNEGCTDCEAVIRRLT